MARGDPYGGWFFTLADFFRQGYVLLVIAYASAVVSILSYGFIDGGVGAPSKLQLVLLFVPLLIIWRLSFKSAWG